MTIYANEQNKGRITYLNGTYEPCICIYKGRRWKWEKMSDLSAANFRKYRSYFSAELKKILDQNRTQVNIKYEPRPEEYKLMTELFNKLDKNKRIILLQKYKNTKIGNSICIYCLKYTNSEKKQCIHIGCPGLCNTCFGNGEFESCPACNKKQELECPICLDKFSKKDLAQFVDCRHAVCWKCFGKSHLTAKPIKKCPLCRKDVKIKI
ncbi:RING finger protein [Aureispira]|nr:RING finger protein [Aureispira sp.]